MLKKTRPSRTKCECAMTDNDLQPKDNFVINIFIKLALHGETHSRAVTKIALEKTAELGWPAI